MPGKSAHLKNEEYADEAMFIVVDGVKYMVVPHLFEIYKPKIDQLITEDDEPVDNIFSEKQQRLLTESLYSSWDGGGRKFIALANVGLFNVIQNPAIVPDVLLSLDVQLHPDIWAKEHRSYYLWDLGKPPDVVIEIVSNKVGKEADEKRDRYARMRVEYYIILDPIRQLGNTVLTIYRLRGSRYRRQLSRQLDSTGLGVTLWEGQYEGTKAAWLRWVDAQGKLIPTGKERAEKERTEKESALRQAEKERTEKESALQQAEKERTEKESALQQAERLAARLRELGEDPDKV